MRINSMVQENNQRQTKIKYTFWLYNPPFLAQKYTFWSYEPRGKFSLSDEEISDFKPKMALFSTF